MAVLSLKFTDFDALIFIFSPVNGFLPSLADLSVILNVPNPATTRNIILFLPKMSTDFNKFSTDFSKHYINTLNIFLVFRKIY